MIKYDDKIISIEEIGEGEMIDIEVDKDHLFYANGILTKNSYGIPATADFMAIYGIDEEAMIYQSEIYYKIVKNRLGGRVGETNKFFYDTRSLKMYDAMEEDLWVMDASISGDKRSAAERQELEQGGGRRSRG